MNKIIVFIVAVSILSAAVPAVIMFSLGDTTSALITIGIGVFIFLVIYFLFLRGLIRRNKVLKNGDPGTARILSVHDTNITINDNPMVRLEVEVTPRRGSKYTTSLRTVVSRINPTMYRPGMTLPVKIDPNDTSFVVIDTSQSANSTQNTLYDEAVSGIGEDERVKAMSALLERVNQERIYLLSNGSDAEGVIMNSWPLNVNVNEVAVAMEFLVEVKIPGRPAFTAEIKGVVANENVGKYANGVRVKIKYDPSDPQNKLTVAGVV